MATLSTLSQDAKAARRVLRALRRSRAPFALVNSACAYAMHAETRLVLARIARQSLSR